MPEETHYRTSERRQVFELLAISAGMMGAYTYNLRGGIFCNAQTANFVLMAMAFGKGEWLHGLYFFVPISAYWAGAFLSELLPKPMEQRGWLSWDALLTIIEILALFVIGWIPLTLPHQIVQISINFICSMQYNTFRQAEGIPMATTFCTNHLRQVGIHTAHYLRQRDPVILRRITVHVRMLLSFTGGGILLTVFCPILAEKSIWLAIVPLSANLMMLLRDR